MTVHLLSRNDSIFPCECRLNSIAQTSVPWWNHPFLRVMMRLEWNIELPWSDRNREYTRTYGLELANHSLRFNLSSKLSLIPDVYNFPGKSLNNNIQKAMLTVKDTMSETPTCQQHFEILFDCPLFRRIFNFFSSELSVNIQYRHSVNKTFDRCIFEIGPILQHGNFLKNGIYFNDRTIALNVSAEDGRKASLSWSISNLR